MRPPVTARIPRWVNVSQASSWGVDTGRYRAHAKTQTVLQRWGEPEVKCFQEKKKKRVKSGDKSNNSQCKQQRRLAGSLHAKIGLLVLTRTIHTPERNTGDMRAMLGPGVIEHLHTLYSHLSIHAKPPAEDAGTGYLLSFVRAFHFMVSGKLSAVTQIDGNLLLTSADTDRTIQIE